jgi:hypothetical protein
MAPPFEDQQQRCIAQNEAINVLFEAIAGGDETAWSSLALKLGEALRNPALHDFQRARYHVLSTWCTQKPDQLRLHLEKARETLSVLVLGTRLMGGSQKDFDEIKPLQDMLAIAEEAHTTGALEALKEDRKARQEKYAPPLHERKSSHRRSLTIL